jgi:hypothetical protein
MESLQEEQIEHIVAVLTTIGITAQQPAPSLGGAIDALVLPSFQSLSVDDALYASLLNMLPDTWPVRM